MKTDLREVLLASLRRDVSLELRRTGVILDLTLAEARARRAGERAVDAALASGATPAAVLAAVWGLFDRPEFVDPLGIGDRGAVVAAPVDDSEREGLLALSIDGARRELAIRGLVTRWYAMHAAGAAAISAGGTARPPTPALPGPHAARERDDRTSDGALL